MKTLGEFIVEKQHDFPHATGELTALISAIKLGAKIIHRDINKAGLVDILGASGVENVQGEQQMKLDLFANEKLKAALKARGIVAGIASEEEDEFVIFEGSDRGRPSDAESAEKLTGATTATAEWDRDLDAARGGRVPHHRMGVRARPRRLTGATGAAGPRLLGPSHRPRVAGYVDRAPGMGGRMRRPSFPDAQLGPGQATPR